MPSLTRLATRAFQKVARPVLGAPAPVVNAVLGRPPINDRGAPLDRQLWVLLALEKLIPGAALVGGEPSKMRRDTRRSAALVAPHTPWPMKVETTTIAGCWARIYEPRRVSGSGRPALLYLHGGGFVVGDLVTHASCARMLAHYGECVVIALDYRLAPEHRFPAAVDDVRRAFLEVVERATALGIDSERVAIGGDSAGGNLSAVASIELRDAKGPMPAFQLLIYPATDMTRSATSQRTFDEGFYLEGETIDWFLEQYTPDPAVRTTWRASPLFVEDCAGLPPAHVVVAGFDPLRDEGEAYAQRLKEADVPCTITCESSLVHGFFNMGGASAACLTATIDLARALRRGLSR